MNTKSLLCYLILLAILLVQYTNLIKTGTNQKVTLEMLQNYENLEGQLKKGISKVNETGTIELVDGTIIDCAGKTIMYKNSRNYLAFKEMQLERIDKIVLESNAKLERYKTKDLYYLTVVFEKQGKNNTEVYVLEEV